MMRGGDELVVAVVVVIEELGMIKIDDMHTIYLLPVNLGFRI